MKICKIKSCILLAEISTIILLLSCSNAVEEVSKPSQLKIIHQPKSVSASDGASAAFSADASGPATINYQWRKNGGNISGATSNKHIIPRVSMADNGVVFDVIISSGTSQLISNPATLTVREAVPTIISQPSSIDTLIGGDATFRVATSGTPPITFQWYRDGVELAGETNSTYTITEVSLNDDGAIFTVIAKNSTGKTTSNSAELGLKQFSLNISVSGLKIDSTIKIQNGNGEITTFKEDGTNNFIVRIRDGSDFDINISSQPETPPQNCFLINDSGRGTIRSADTSIYISCLNEVAPLFPAVGANWNDYVLKSNSSVTQMEGVTCSATNNYFDCINGGELRHVTVHGLQSCNGVDAKDKLNAFIWECDQVNSNEIRFISYRLNSNTSLSDLVDFPFSTWKENRLIITNNSTIYGETPSSIWWGNSIASVPASGVLDIPGTVYLANINSKIPVSIVADKVSLLIKPKLALTLTNNAESVVSATGQKYLWIEGDIRANKSTYGLYFRNTSNSRVQKMNVFGLSTNRAAESSTEAVYLWGSFGNYFNSINTINASSKGINLTDSSSNNIFQNINSTNNGEGITITGSSNNVFTNITIANNSTNGIRLSSNSTSNSFINSVLSSNHTGLTDESTGFNLLINTAAFNNSYSGVTLLGTRGTILNITTAHNGNINPQNVTEGYGILTSKENYYTGIFQMGNNLDSDCRTIGFGIIYYGIVDDTCVANGLSDHQTPVPDINLSNTFIGQVITDDRQNSSDRSGSQSASQILDWVSFESDFRFWGQQGSSSLFPNPDQQRRCGYLDSCQILDLSLKNNDVVLRETLTVPTGDDIATHTWSGDTSVRFLRNCIEVIGDKIGNENGLCESNEACIYTPNIGDYQGHGNLIELIFAPGQLSNISLYRYESNGF